MVPVPSRLRRGTAGLERPRAQAALARSDAEQHEQAADRLVPRQPLAQERDAGDRREHGHEVGHRRRGGRAGVADDRVVEQVRRARPGGAERGDGRERPGRERHPGCRPRTEARARAAACPSRAARTRAPEPRALPSRGCGGGTGSRCRRGSPRRGRPRCPTSSPLPIPRHAPSTTSTPAKPEREAERALPGRAAPRAASGARRRARRAASCRSRCPPAATTTCCSPNAKSVNGALLTSTAATNEMAPRARVARQAAALREHDGHEREQAEEHAAERHLHRREAAVADLDEHERHAPDRAQQHEPRRPRRRAPPHARARSRSSRKRFASSPPP